MVWIIGSGGMLGSQLRRTLEDRKIACTGSGSGVSVIDPDALGSFAAGKDISFIVNCAAYTAVDKAESEAELAAAVNAYGARNVAALAGRLGVPLVHISTDYVFDGIASSPVSEDDEVSPLGVYGKTKADGERAVAEETDDFYILRTAWLYGFYGRNFVYTMIRAMNSRASVSVVCDQRGTPTSCVTLSSVIADIIGRRSGGGKIPGGIYHLTDLGETTWFDFALEIKRVALDAGILGSKDCAVSPCATADYPTPARRPAYSVLDKSKIQRTLGITLPEWQKSLDEFIRSARFDKTRIV